METMQLIETITSSKRALLAGIHDANQSDYWIAQDGSGAQRSAARLAGWRAGGVASWLVWAMNGLDKHLLGAGVELLESVS